MNSVHEPGSRTMFKNFDSGKYRVEPGQKQAECTKCIAQGQAARPAPSQPCPALSARARACHRALPRAPIQSPPAAGAKPACVSARVRAPTAILPRAPRAPQRLRAPGPTCALARAPTHARLRAPRGPTPAQRLHAQQLSPAQLPSLAIYLGSSPKFNFSAQKVFIIIKNFFSIYLQKLEKSLKSLKSIFFFHFP